MTEPEQSTPPESPSHFVQVAVKKAVDFVALSAELRAALAVKESDILHVAILSDAPPPFGPDNMGVLSVGAVGYEFDLDEVKGVVEGHIDNAPAPEVAPLAESEPPTIVRDPDLDPEPTSEDV